ncbi:hypothetical protein R1flu_003293 [Riccia fluitans]|uniref:Uncharacterized protein n=1 Tax=Riccia fluitans TaxID=41844 RepID=A0ABD1Y8R3_9MARC
MGCRQSLLATEPKIKKSKETDDALQGSPRVELANRPQSADAVAYNSPRKNSFKLQPIPKFVGGPKVGQLAVSIGKVESKTEQTSTAPPLAPARPPLQRLKSALKSPSKNFDDPASVG